MLCFVVLNVAGLKKGCQEWFGLAIGFVIVAGAYGVGAFTGGCFNPAVAFGIDVSSLHLGFGWSILYTSFELCGAAIAVALFKVVRPLGGQEDEEYPISAKLASEFIGTYMLVVTVGFNIIAASQAAAFSIAASLMCMIYALGDVSGANFNPAVTIALWLKAELEPATAFWYMLVQIMGGMFGSLTCAAVYGGTSGFGSLGPHVGYTATQAYTAEAVFTFVLVLVVLCAAVNPKTASTKFFGLAIGSCVTVGGCAIGAISGGALNPAISISLGTVTKSFTHIFGYVAAECIGAIAATGLVTITHGDYYDKEEKMSLLNKEEKISEA